VQRRATRKHRGAREEVAGRRYTVAGSAVLGAVAYARARGIETRAVLEAAGLHPAALAGSDARAPQAAYNAVFDELTARSGDADFGLHFAERLDLDAFHVVGYVAARSETFGRALERIAALSRLVHDAGRFDVERDADQVLVHPGCRGLVHEFPRQVAEFATASTVVLGRRITGQSWRPRRVEFRHPRPSRVSEHVRIFGIEPRFDRPETAIALDPALLDLPIRSADAGVAGWLDAYAREALARLPKDSDDIVAQVKRAVVVGLERGSMPDLVAIAAQLAITPRTLQRRLTALGTRFADVADGARREMAERWLSDPRISSKEIAFLAGFADPSNFHRAFRRWTGTTPDAWRAHAARLAPEAKRVSRRATPRRPRRT
jgi:AraC-like DNA-binding protein